MAFFEKKFWGLFWNSKFEFLCQTTKFQFSSLMKNLNYLVFLAFFEKKIGGIFLKFILNFPSSLKGFKILAFLWNYIFLDRCSFFHFSIFWVDVVFFIFQLSILHILLQCLLEVHLDILQELINQVHLKQKKSFKNEFLKSKKKMYLTLNEILMQSCQNLRVLFCFGNFEPDVAVVTGHCWLPHDASKHS